jgi:hypothetical protein
MLIFDILHDPFRSLSQKVGLSYLEVFGYQVTKSLRVQPKLTQKQSQSYNPSKASTLGGCSKHAMNIADIKLRL